MRNSSNSASANSTAQHSTAMDNSLTATVLDSSFSHITEIVSSLQDGEAPRGGDGEEQQQQPQPQQQQQQQAGVTDAGVTDAGVTDTTTASGGSAPATFTIVTVPTTEKKRPGRPRKHPQREPLTDGVKRGRGRPRKYTVEERPSRPKLPPLLDENGNVVKRKRGRPRKHPLPDHSKPKRGRGRPRKDNSAPLLSGITIEEQPVQHQQGQRGQQDQHQQDQHQQDHQRSLALGDVSHEEALNINLNLMDLYGST